MVILLKNSGKINFKIIIHKDVYNKSAPYGSKCLNTCLLSSYANYILFSFNLGKLNHFGQPFMDCLICDQNSKQCFHLLSWA